MINMRTKYFKNETEIWNVAKSIYANLKSEMNMFLLAKGDMANILGRVTK